MRFAAVLLICAASLAYAGVKSRYFRKEKLAGFQSFQWSACTGLDEDLVLAGVLTDQNLRGSVFPQLEQRGLTEAITSGDLTVHCEAYTRVRGEPDRNAAGRGRTGIDTMGTSPSLRVTILLEIRAAGSEQAVWQASISGPLSELKHQKSLDRAVRKAFGK
jgi:hypothetical protein